mgnify:CR=1 FL=1
MQYVTPYTFLTARPGGVNNLLLASAALLSSAFVPVIGQLMVMGWLAEVADELDRDPELREYPDFDLNRFVPYLTRSVWPFVVQLIVSVILLVLLGLAAGVGIVVWAVSNEPLAGVAVGAALAAPALAAALMLTWPMTLHAQLSRSFSPGESVRFTRAFLGAVGGQQAVVLVVHLAVSAALSVVGFLCCFVGLYPVLAIQLASQEHYLIQLYRLYLDEGGEPIRRLDG